MTARVLVQLLRYPLAGLVLALAVWAGGGWLLWQHLGGSRPLAVDASVSGLLPRASPELARYEAVRRRYGDDDVLLVAWLADPLFDTDTLARLRDFTYALETVPGVLAVDSLATALAVSASEGIIELDEFLREVPQDADELSALRERALASPLLRGTLVAADGTAALTVVQMDPSLAGPAQFALVDRIRALSATHAGPVDNVLTGPAYARIELSRILFDDLARVLPLAIAATMLVAGLAMRSVRALVVPMIATAGAMVTTMAVFLANGHALNFVTVIVAPVVFVLGFAYAIHCVSAIEERLGRGGGHTVAIDAALADAAGAISLNAALEVVGFLSLAASSIDAIRVFGLYSALGIALAWIGALVFVPAALKLVPALARPRRPDPRTGGAIGRLAHFDLGRRRSLLWGGALLTAVALAATTRIEIGTDYLGVLPSTHPVVRDFARVADRFDGIVPVQILIESDVPGHFKDPAQLAHLVELERWLEAQPEIGGAITLIDYLGVLYRAFVPDAPADAVLPDKREMIDQLLLLGAGNQVERFADARYGATLLHARTTLVETADIARLVARIEARLDALPPHLHGHVTGSSVLLVRAIDDITWGQVTSLAATALAIYAALSLIFGSLRLGALALIPNLVPIAVLFGILGLTGIELDVTTSLVAPIVLAIVIDDTVHFLLRFNREARQAASESVGVERALSATFRPVAYSTLGLVAGFLALGASELTNQVEFGLLAAAVMMIAWLLDLTFTPALASRLRFVTLWETLAIDLGCREPQATIPLFQGLSARQAKTAAILGSLRSFAPGERIFAVGDEAKEIYVVIEGEVVARVPHDDGDTELRHLTRGEMIGAASLFHGRHFANVDAVGPVRMLRLGETCLGHIQRRYPRIGAQIYRNLSAIMAARFADMAVRV